MHCGVRFGRSSCMATNRVECIKSCGHKSNHSRKLAAKQQKDTPFQIQEGGIWPGIMRSITTYNLFPLDKNTSVIGALTWLFVSEMAASSHSCTFFWYPKCTQYGWQGFEQVNYSSFLRIFLSQFFLKLLRAPKNRSSVLVASFASNFNAVSSIVQIRSAACASR